MNRCRPQDDIISGAFSEGMMADWDNNDANLLKWRAATGETNFEKTPAGSMVRGPTTWTIFQHDGPNHLGLW